MSRNDQTSARSRREIESDLSDNRARLDHTLELLEDRFTPGALFDQAWRYARTKTEDGTTSRVRDTVVRNPLPVTLMGVGLAWLFFAGRGGSVPSESTAAGRASHDRHAEPSGSTDRPRAASTPGVAERTGVPASPTDSRPASATTPSAEHPARPQTGGVPDKNAPGRASTHAPLDPNSPSADKSQASGTEPAGTRSPSPAATPTTHNR